MQVDEVTVPSPDLPEGLSFGPVTLQSFGRGSFDNYDELPVMLTPHRYQCLGVTWYFERCRTRGVFDVKRDEILFTPTGPVLTERASWWRRAGYRLLSFLGQRAPRAREHAASDP